MTALIKKLEFLFIDDDLDMDNFKQGHVCQTAKQGTVISILLKIVLNQ